MAHHLFLVLSGFFHRYGYWTVFGAALLENICIPVPGEATLLFAGYLARRGELALTWSIIAALAGSIIGEWIGYEIGQWGGKAILDRIRKRFFIHARTFDRTQTIFLRNGGWVVVVARFVSGLRELMGIIAGVYRMPRAKFMLFNCVGAILWSVAIASLGYALGASWRRLVHFFARVNYAAAAVFVGVIIFLIIRSTLKRGTQNTPR